MYDVNDYGRMLADPARMNAYTEALRRAVKPGSVVVDVGTGIGTFALLAAQFGARKVYAIDNNPCIELARATAKRNGLADRIEFIHKSVFDVTLPEKADVLISDCRGKFALYGRSLEIVIWARDHLLKPNGTVIAWKDELLAALVHRPKLHADIEAPWKLLGFDWSECRAAAFASAQADDEIPTAEAQLTETLTWSVLDYATLNSLDAHGHGEARATRSGEAHAVALWFRTVTAEGLELPTARCYGSILVPLHPVIALEEGERVEIHVDALKSRESYVFACRVKTGGETRRIVTDGVENLTVLHKIIMT